MKKKDELIKKLDIEELEQRFEMGWGPKFKRGELKYGENGGFDGIDEKKYSY
jgi:hypothetical protein